MKIELHNHATTVLAYEEAEFVWLHEYLAIKETKFRKNYSTGRMERVGEQTISFVDAYNRFPTGFLRNVINKGREKGFTFEIEDKRIRPDVSPDLTADISFLRPYQLEAVDAVCDRSRGILKIGTGGGKTVIATALTLRLPVQWTFLVQSKDLLHQTAKRYKEFTGRDAGIIGDGQLREPGQDANLVVATVQTLSAKRGNQAVWKFLERADGIMVDEAHGLGADTVFRVVMATQRAWFRVGLSGTPLDRSDKRSIMVIGAIGPIIHETTAKWLIENGYLSKPHIEMWECKQNKTRPSYHGIYNELITRSSKRSTLTVQQMLKAAKPNLTFVLKVEHGRLLTARARKLGLTVDFVWGSKSTKARDQAINRLVRGETDSIIASPVFVQGIDIPELESLVIATGGKATIPALQRLGRGMRITEEKNTFEVYDIFDVGNDILNRHSKARMRAYKREEHEVEVIKEKDL